MWSPVFSMLHIQNLRRRKQRKRIVRSSLANILNINFVLIFGLPD